MLVGGINTANMLISITTAYALQKARNGAIVSIMDIMGKVSLSHALFFVAAALISGAAATWLAIVLSRGFARAITRVNYRSLVSCIIAFIVLLSILFDGGAGLAILATASALGIAVSLSGVGKSHLMGCLIVPVILYFVG